MHPNLHSLQCEGLLHTAIKSQLRNVFIDSQPVLERFDHILFCFNN